MPYNYVTHDGFKCSFGRFYTKNGVERVDGARLKSIFLPRLTPEANKLLRNVHDFVRGQLQHYGVQYNEKDFSGNGTLLLKKMLQAGRFDKVPDHIEELRSQMHTEWLESLSEKELSGHPEWIMERYFLDTSGSPDPSKTTEVVGFPYHSTSSYSSGQLREAASRVTGLHHATGWGSTQTIYLGWDRDAVEKAAQEHAIKDRQAQQASADSREEVRALKHESYLARAPKRTSPVGQYIIGCEDIESDWPELAENMKLSIRTTPTPGLYQADFNFGVIEGAMMMSGDERTLETFCARSEYNDDSNSEDEDSGDDDDDDEVDEFEASEDDEDNDGEDGQDECFDEMPAVGSKRKGLVKQPRGRPAKKAKAAGPIKFKKLFLRLRSKDTGTGEIHSTPQKGYIKFDGPRFATFTGEASMACIGEGVFFTARKVAATPRPSWDSWDDYSEAAYERARIGRWR
ncbi:hypothetical protein QBC40DRAFT_262003 [Triangularia verruculosa]|uniref:Uncharacterized protein n=1 Tax=Triangularia verruculosa TaxID=2587418 RepID=A0AAN6XP52_9PEZI|nr:hypothetical protein QBC40DRAFT_262003 [Triangularia verruculosa]